MRNAISDLTHCSTAIRAVVDKRSAILEPVENVGFFEIREGSTSQSYPSWPHSIQVPNDSFIGRLRRRTWLATLDLPTESQWEYACRAETTTSLNSGKNLTDVGWMCPNLSEVARHGGNSYWSWSTQNSDTSEATAAVGSYLPNAWGLYDMHGNIAEMCLDWFGDYPATVTDPAGPAFGTSKVTRGGSYNSSTVYCRSASRDICGPSGRSYSAGLRLAVTTYARVPPPGGVSSPPAGMAFIPKGTNLGMDPDFGPYVLPLESSFFMDTCEVSKALWDEVYAWAVANGYGFDRTAAGKAPNHPAQKMHWYDAVKWCNARSEKAGLDPAYYTDADFTQVYRADNLDAPFVKPSASGYRLPTDKQWRYAARGGVEGRRFPWGDSDEIQHARANYVSSPPVGGSTRPDYDTSPSLGYHPVYATGDYPYTSPVGSFAPNGYGLYDMAGNVAEWCFDRVPWQPTNYRYVRGGGYWSSAKDCRVAEMAYSRPEPSQFNEGTGFRTVRSLGSAPAP